jgi:uncharacterized protein YgbK (DUF1537 family)
VLLDVLEDRHLAAIGALLRHLAADATLLTVGASSVAEAWFADAEAAEPPEAGTPAGQVFAFAGSLSPVTRAQIAAARSYEVIEIRPDEIADDSDRRRGAIGGAVSLLASGSNVLVSTAPLQGPAPKTVARGLAQASASFVEAVLRQSGVRRIAIAGGDTSTAIATGLGFWGLAYHGRAARGVTVCRARSDESSRDGMLVMLKGGQMGDDHIFDRFAG